MRISPRSTRQQRPRRTGVERKRNRPPAAPAEGRRPNTVAQMARLLGRYRAGAWPLMRLREPSSLRPAPPTRASPPRNTPTRYAKRQLWMTYPTGCPSHTEKGTLT